VQHEILLHNKPSGVPLEKQSRGNGAHVNIALTQGSVKAFGHRIVVANFSISDSLSDVETDIFEVHVADAIAMLFGKDDRVRSADQHVTGIEAKRNGG
jgi:hypothetical protein